MTWPCMRVCLAVLVVRESRERSTIDASAARVSGRMVSGMRRWHVVNELVLPCLYSAGR